MHCLSSPRTHKAMPLTLACVNPKGGVGKTTTAVHLSVAAYRTGTAVTLIDADPQGSAVDWCRRTPEGYDRPTIEQLGNRTIAAAVGQAGAEMVVIDSPACLDERTRHVLLNADLALVPVSPSGLDLWGTAEFVELVETRVKDGMRAAFVLSQADVRTSLADELDFALDRLGIPLLRGLTSRVAYARSMSEGQTVLDGYDPHATGEVERLLRDVGGLFS